MVDAPHATRACIVTTVRHPGPPLLSFIRYHLSLGFARIYVFFDDPEDPWFAAVSDLPDVTAIRCDEALLARQRRDSTMFERMEQFLNKEVMARQILNAEVAIQLARDEGAGWLLHVDIDELFYCEGSVAEHFAAIPAKVGQVHYLNHEALPEAIEIDDYFQSVTLFKRNPHECSPAAVTRWLAAAGRERYFLAYRNGKAAVRLVEGVFATSVHAFDISATGLESLAITEPRILHYVNCGIDYFTRKYVQRGAFSDNYFDRWPRLPFHLQARDIVRTADGDAIRNLYARHILCRGASEAETLIASGLGLRITAPRDLLAPPPSPASPSSSMRTAG